ncbi:MAG: tripartite tricarboxylate transporter substrate binding protein [Pseudomonadota bacterium]
MTSFIPRRIKLSLAVLCFASAGAAHAQAYPDRPIKLVVPYAAGGGTDIFARAIAVRMGTELGQTIIIENKPGAGTIIGAEMVARSAPDGYTVLLGDTGTYSMNPSLYKKLPYDPARDLAPVTLTGRFALTMVVHPSVPANTVQEYIALAAAKPGKINYATPGQGSPHHLAMELFSQQAKVTLTHVPYKGNGPAVSDLMAGHVESMFLVLGPNLQHVKAGKMKAIGVSSPKRLAPLPNVPTIAEAGLKGYEAWSWQGLTVPRGTPASIIARLNAAYAATANDPEIRKKMDAVSVELITSTPQEMATYMKSETEKWAKTIKNANIVVE